MHLDAAAVDLRAETGEHRLETRVLLAGRYIVGVSCVIGAVLVFPRVDQVQARGFGFSQNVLREIAVGHADLGNLAALRKKSEQMGARCRAQQHVGSRFRV